MMKMWSKIFWERSGDFQKLLPIFLPLVLSPLAGLNNFNEYCAFDFFFVILKENTRNKNKRFAQSRVCVLFIVSLKSRWIFCGTHYFYKRRPECFFAKEMKMREKKERENFIMTPSSLARGENRAHGEGARVAFLDGCSLFPSHPKKKRSVFATHEFLLHIVS